MKEEEKKQEPVKTEKNIPRVQVKRKGGAARVIQFDRSGRGPKVEEKVEKGPPKKTKEDLLKEKRT